MTSRLAAILSVLALTACAKEPGVYNLPKQEALARLHDADTAGFRRAWQCGILIHFQPTDADDSTVTWRVVSDGETMLSFTVLLEDLGGNRTKAVIEVPPDPRGGEYYDGKKDYPRPALNQPIRPGIEELVDAAMNQRKFSAVSKGHEPVCDGQRTSVEGGVPPFKVFHKRQFGVPY